MEVEREDSKDSNISESTISVILSFVEKHPRKAISVVLSLISGLIVGWIWKR